MMLKLAQPAAILGAIVGILATAMVLGQTDQPTGAEVKVKVGIINFEQIFQTSEEGKREMARFTQALQERQKEEEKKTNDLQALRERYSSQLRTLNRESVAEMQNQITQADLSLKRFREDTENQANQLRNEIFNRVGSKLQGVVNEYSQSNGYGLVLRLDPTGQTQAYVSPALDITQEILKIYNEKYP